MMIQTLVMKQNIRKFITGKIKYHDFNSKNFEFTSYQA